MLEVPVWERGRLNGKLAVVCAAGILACSGGNDRIPDPGRDRASVLQGVLDRFRRESRFPGAVLGAWFADSSVVVVASGVADRSTGAPISETCSSKRRA